MLNKMNYAAIDVGSNAIRMLIQNSVVMSKEDYYFQKISMIRIPIRLGKDVFSRGSISKNKSIKLIKAFEVFKLLMEIHDVSHFRACATSAMREASNGEKVRKEIEDSTSVPLEIISGKEEAKLIFSNFYLIDPDPNVNYIYIDVGGGSTELTLIRNNQKIASRSFNIGSVRRLQQDVNKKIWIELADWTKEQITACEEIDAMGTGGSINKLYSLSTHRFQEALDIEELRKIISMISSYTFEDRIRILKLKPNRADVIIPAGDIYQKVMEVAGAKKIIVPKVGLSDGIIFELFHKYEA